MSRRLASPDAETTSIPAPPPRMSVVSSSEEDVYWTATRQPVARWNGPTTERSAYPGIASIDSEPSLLPSTLGGAGEVPPIPAAGTHSRAVRSTNDNVGRRARTSDLLADPPEGRLYNRPPPSTAFVSRWAMKTGTMVR